MVVCQTTSLKIRHFNNEDYAFILTLLNEESFIKYIGDKKVRTIDDALNYLQSEPLLSYKKRGFGLYMVTIKESDTPIGMCGLLKRDGLEYADLGYAFLPEFCGKGYAKEASIAVLEDAHKNHNISTVSAVTAPDNKSSNNLLKKIGFLLKGSIKLYSIYNHLYEYRF